MASRSSKGDDANKFDLITIISRYRNAIYGFAILWILIFHGSAIDGIDYSFGQSWLVPFKSFINKGNVGVDMFLFLSGVCLYFSFIKKQDYYEFIKRRLKRVVVTTLLIYTPYWFIRNVLIQGSVVTFFSKMTLLRFWITGDSTMWFISLILILYFAYPFIFKFLFNGKHDGVRFIILLTATLAFIFLFARANRELFDMCEIAWTRIPVFICGCWWGKYVYEKKHMPAVFGVLCVVIGIGFFFVLKLGILHGIYKRLFFGLGGIALSYAFALLFHALTIVLRSFGDAIIRFLSWVGGFSLELYCAHIMLNQVLRMFPWYVEGTMWQYALVIVIAPVLAWVAMKIGNAIIAAVEKRIAAKKVRELEGAEQA